jgi:hypothetical protein
MTPYILTAYNSRLPLAEGTLLDCWKVLREFADGSCYEAASFYRIDKATQSK